MSVLMSEAEWYEAVNARLAALERQVDELQRRTLPMVPFGPPQNFGPFTGCPVCGIGADGKPYGYVCTRADCPSSFKCS